MFIGLVVFLAVVILIICVVVGGALLVIHIARQRDKDGGRFDFKTILKVYMYFITLVSLALSSFALINLGKALVTFAAGYKFSYSESYIDVAPKPVPDKWEPSDYHKNLNTEERTRDILNGTIMFAFGLIIFLVHKAGTYYLEKDETDKPSIFEKMYIFSVLILYSIISIIAIPTAVYQIANYYVVENNWTSFGMQRPGEPLATALVTTPIWIIFVYKAVMLYKKNRVEERGTVV